MPIKENTSNPAVARQQGYKLNVILTLWFLVVAVVPSLCVAFVGYSLHNDQLLREIRADLTFVSRMKESELGALFDAAAASARSVALQYNAVRSRFESDREAIRAVLDAGAGTSQSVLYAVNRDTSEVAGGEPLSPGELGRPGDSGIGSVRIQGAYWHVAGALTEMTTVQNNPGETVGAASAWMVIAAIPAQSVDEALHRHVNDSKFFSRKTAVEPGFGLGKTADAFLVDEKGVIVSGSLMVDSAQGQSLVHEGMQRWFAYGAAKFLNLDAVIGDRSVMLHARRINLGEKNLSLVVTMNRGEAAERLYTGQRTLLSIYLGSLVIVFIVLYFFVANLSRIVVRPIGSLMNGLTQLSNRLRQGSASMTGVVLAQGKVASQLSKNYKKQLQTVREVDREIQGMMRALLAVGEQTRIAVLSISQIDARASRSITETEIAQTGIRSIQLLATAHRTLIETLEGYNAEVDSIARDVRKLASASTYISMNAAIEAGKPFVSSRSVSTLVSEMGKLSELSNSATERINVLVTGIGRHLAETKSSAAHEQREAEASIKVIARALENIRSILNDTKNIAASVSAINEQISKQSEGTKNIARQSLTLTGEAGSTLGESVKIQALAVSLTGSVRSNSAVVRKLSSIVARLQSIIEFKKS